MKKGIGTSLVQAGTVVGLVAIPAFGGQIVSAAAKAASNTVNGLPDVAVDAAATVLVGAAEVALVMALKGKGGAAKVVPFAIAGALFGTLLPHFNSGVDSVVRSIVGGSAAPVALPAATPSLRLASGATPGGIGSLRVGLGGTVPGGANAVAKTGGVLY